MRKSYCPNAKVCGKDKVMKDGKRSGMEDCKQSEMKDGQRVEKKESLRSVLTYSK